MTTAHKPTWHPAKGQSNGISEGGFMTGGAISHQFSAKDMPSHVSLKTRKHGQGSKSEVKLLDMKKQLEEREAKHRIESNKSKRGMAIEDRARKKQRLLEDSSSAAAGPRAEDAEDYDDSDDEVSDSDSSSDSNSDSDDDEEAELLAELAKIKKEREAEAKKKAREEAEVKAEEQRQAILKGNPLMAKVAATASVVVRPWDDDVVFKNQARDEKKLKKRFINDTVRNDFHKKFLTRYIGSGSAWAGKAHGGGGLFNHGKN